MDQVSKIKRDLEKTMPTNDTKKVLELLGSLDSMPMTLEILQSTHIGKTVNKIRKTIVDNEIGSLSKGMVKKWKKLLSSTGSSGGGASEKTKDSSSTPSITTSNTGNSAAPNSKDFNNGNSHNSYDSNSNSSPCSASGLNNNNNNSIISSNNNINDQGDGLRAGSSTPPTSQNQNSGSNKRPHSNNDHDDNDDANISSSNKQRTQQAPPAAAPAVKRPVPVQTKVPSTNCEVRLKCRKLICDALKKPIPKDLAAQESLMEEEILAGRIEECIFQEFRMVDKKYKNRVFSRTHNLGDMKNPYLRFNVLNGSIHPERIAKMTAEEMASDELKKEREKFTKEAINDHQMALTTGAKTSDIKCPACKKFNVTYNQVQTRSADEPMTTFCFCNECGKRWKFC